DAVVGDLGDVQQAVASRQYLNDGTEIQQTQYGAFVFLAHFDVGGKFFDATFSFPGLVEIRTGDGDIAIVVDIDLSTSLFGEGTDGCAALANHITDLLWVDLERQHARREFRQLSA